MSETFLVMLPCDKDLDPEAGFRKHTQNMGFRLAKVRPFPMPNFKVGTLDSLMEASDELNKVDVSTEMSVLKILQTGEQLYLETQDKSNLKKIRQELMHVNVVERDPHNSQLVEKSKDTKSYIENWSWDEFKYTDVSGLSIKKVIDDLQKPVFQAEDLIKKRVAEYSDLRQRAGAAEKKVGGNLQVKDVSQEIESWNKSRKTPLPENVLTRKGTDGSSQLVVLFVVVPKKDVEEWKKYPTWGITDEQKDAMHHVRHGETDHAADSVSITGIKFKNEGKEVDLSSATASNPGGSRDGYSNGKDNGSPSNAIDGKMDTAWFDANKKALVITFKEPTRIDEYEFTTGQESPYRDPVQWTLEGFTPGKDTKAASLTVEIEGAGSVTITKGQSEAAAMTKLHETLSIPAGKRIVLKDASGNTVKGTYDQLENGAKYSVSVEDLAGNAYSKKEAESGSWHKVHAVTKDHKVPTARKTSTGFIKISKPNTYTKYRFVPKVMRGSPEKGPIPCGNGAVPGTSEVVTTVGEYNLMSVMVFSQLEASFRNLCRERKYAVREYEPRVSKSGKKPKSAAAEFTSLENKKNEKKDALLRDVKVHFSECFAAWVHIKALRAFVESILRYGLPAKYISMLFVCDNNKAHDEMRSKIMQTFSHLNPKGVDLHDDANATSALQEQYPYVSVRMPALDAQAR